MRPEELTVEVRDRNLQRKGQVLPRDLNLSAKLRWCGVGEWTLTLPGNHEMVPYLMEEGSGLLVTGPVGQELQPAEYTDWVETRRNLVAYSKANGAIPTGWSVANGSYTGDWVVSTATGASTPYIFAGLAQEAFVTGDPIAARITVQSDSTDIQYLRVNVHQRTGNLYFTGDTTQIVVPVTPGVPVEVPLSWVATKDIPTNDLDVSVVPCTAGGAFISPPAGAVFKASYEIISRGTTTGRYFNGGFPSGDLVRYRWAGTANASISFEDTRSVTREPWYKTLFGPIFSGPTLSPNRKRDQKNPDGTLTFKGVTDEVLLEDALAFPDPQGSADPNAQTKANDTRTGVTEALMRQYVAYNVTYDQALPGRVRGFRQYLDLKGTSLNRGVTQTKSPRFQNLLELLQEIAIYDGGLGFRVIQEGDLLLFEVVPVRDLRGTVRLDVNTGTVTSEEITATGPSLTDAIVGGQGEGADRTMVRRTDLTSETTWMRPIERFFDRRDTDDPALLQQKGDEELIAAEGGTSAKIVPSDDLTMQYLKDWRQGDWITVVVNGEERDSVVTEAVLLFDSSKAIVGAAIGDVATFSPENRQTRKQESIDSRLSYLERTGGLPARLDEKAHNLGTTDLDTIRWSGWMVQSANANATSARHYPVAQAGHLQSIWSDEGSDFGLQIYTDFQNKSEYRRTYYNGTWFPWRSADGVLRGTTAYRNNTVSDYFQFFWDTDLNQLFVGDLSGGWRRYSGVHTDSAKAWDSSGASGTVSIYGRSVTVTIPTRLESNEYLQITPIGTGTGFGVMSSVAQVRNANDVTLTVRLMQFLNASTQAFTFAWQVVPV